MIGSGMRLADLADELGRDIEGDREVWIEGVAPLDDAGPADLSFVRSAQFAASLSTTGAGAVIAPHDMDAGGRPTIRSPNPGLDFSRAKHLVNLLVKRAQSSGIQLIMSTNDSFIMNTVDIENWAVLHRDGNKISLYNYENSKEIFEDFKFTGLNNFDFYASEFFKSGFSDKSE